MGQTEGLQKQNPSSWPVVLGAILATSLAVLNTSILSFNVIADGNGTAVIPEHFAWVITAYYLPIGAFLLVAGAAGDRLGRRSVILAGALIFACGGAVGAYADGLTNMLVARLLQGTGAALLMPNSIAALAESFDGKARARVIGFWSAASAAASAAGPALGGGLFASGHWRLIFALNVPIALIIFVLAIGWKLPAIRPKRGWPVNMPGAVLCSVGLASLTWASGGQGVVSRVGAAAIALVCLVAFTREQRRLGSSALVPPALVASAGFIQLTLFTFLFYGAFFSLLVLLPSILIVQAGWSPAAASNALIPMPFLLALGAPVSGILVARSGPWGLLALAPVFFSGGMVWLLRITGSATYGTDVLPAVTLIAVGVCAGAAPLTAAVLEIADKLHVGAAAGLNSTVSRTGGLLATALMGPALAVRGHELGSALRFILSMQLVAVIASAIVALILFRRMQKSA